MKNFKIFSILFLFVLGLNSCSSDDDFTAETPEPTADFSFEAVADNPQLISFTNLSVDADEFMWDFGDETGVSTQKHPSYQYASAGNYTVKLTAMNGDNTSTYSEEVSVLGVPSAAFSYEVDEEDTYTVHFENQSQNVAEYSWDFGDGSEGSSEASPSHTYAETGIYTVTLTATGAGGTAEASMEVEVKDAQPAFSNVYIVGDASESGWNIGSPAAFTQSETNPFVFVYEGVLTPGNIKFSTFTGDWCDGQWINAAENGTSITQASGFIITQGCDGPDNQWQVTEDTQGRYRITVNLEIETINFEAQNAPYSELYLIGDASENGWNIDSPAAGFTQSSTDPFIFTYQGTLNPGEFKIATYTGDWCDADWLHPTQADASPAAGNYEAHLGCTGPDYKWRINEDTQGEYLITVNLYEGTINFEVQ
ncbi:PKD domain-containing protein [Salinimicrobium xinjiangense]|uniref:PKD domain-containing protein n=1 Tax=Salinimicrobium xinjiangense TaxID=438596 RepID=UPI0004125E81|nr:SusF/SusE family outer membrane protein [Salinimicrobium xinjiangense]